MNVGGKELDEYHWEFNGDCGMDNVVDLCSWLSACCKHREYIQSYRTEEPVEEIPLDRDSCIRCISEWHISGGLERGGNR